ncbi:MAG: hypothetical protein RL516_1179 [Bacteroidota bacterium]|jgi:gliding motility-associated-like protein
MSQCIKISNAVLLLVLLSIFSQGQNLQNNKWYFNTGAVDFNSGSPVEIIGSAMSTSEGGASVADKNTGDLLFYTNGITIWNRLNTPMPNGSGLLGGSPALTSSTTAAVIMPRPGNPNQYYVFTVDEQFGSNGLRHNLIDITLNGGLGDVVAGQKNILINNNGISEKLAYAPNANLTGYWLVARQTNGNQYLAWEVTATGISSVPVASTAGTQASNGAGYMKFNKDYTKLANANVFGTVDVMGFNRATGVVTSNISLPVPIGSSVYGVEFSPSGQYLYVSNLLNGLFQFDLKAPNVSSSQQLVASVYAAALQIGPDCKIYIADGSLSEISNPDLPAPLCGYVSNTVTLTSGGSGYGLPMKVIYLDALVPEIAASNNNPCSGNSIQFDLTGLNISQNINWNFGDPSAGSLNTISASPSTPVSFTYAQPGQYIVQAIYNYDCAIDTVFDTITVTNCNPTSGTCLGFTYAGSVQQWTVPTGVDTLHIKMWGAAGGGGADPINNAGGGGGFTELVVPVIPGQVIDITVGGGGKRAVGGVGGVGGWPSGGNGGSGNRPDGGGAGGGGRSEIAIAGITYGIAGGGGGGANNRSGGGGGGAVADFTSTTNNFNVNGFGGNQTSGGAASSNTICPHPVFGTAGSSLQGGTGATDLGGGINDRTAGGGGGDGYYGGGGGGSHDGCFGVGSTGGGGSGYICTSCVGVTGTMTTAGFFGVAANASDPVLASYPGIAEGVNNQNGGDGLVYICFDNCTSTSSTISATSCGSYTSPSGNIYTSTGIYKDTILNAVSCDSIITINLTVNQNYNLPPQIVSACNSYTSAWGTVYTQSGTYSNVYTTTTGCDSIVTINLTISNSITTAPKAVSSCNSYTSSWGTVYTQSGTYSNVYTTTTGCDSIVTINLTINNSITTSPQTVSSCNTYASPWGTVYTQSGTYSNTYTTANGCDSIVTINLTINNSITTAPQTVSSCNTYASPWGTVYTQSGTYSNTYTTANGCDSIVTINLTINNSITIAPQTVSACNTYTSAWGTVYTQSGSYNNSYTTVNGCDSVVTINLTINNNPVANTTVTPDTCGKDLGTATAIVNGGSGPYSYSWSNGANTNTITNLSSGNYSVIITDNNGCTTTNQITITAIPTPTLTTPFSPQTINQGESVSLSVSGATTYSWSPTTGLSCNICADPIASPISSTTYVVTGTDLNGCTATATITVLIDYDCTELFVPTIFSPNGNGPDKNESVCVYSNCIQEMEFAVYNRWGQQIFITNNPQQCWDGTSAGKELATGVYTYRLYVKQLDGIIVSKSGNITLVK